MADQDLDPREKLRLEAIEDAKKNGVIPCPFCASQAIGGAVNLPGKDEFTDEKYDSWLAQVLTLALADDNKDGIFRLWCWDCKINGPIAARMSLAVEAWNKRP